MLDYYGLMFLSQWFDLRKIALSLLLAGAFGASWAAPDLATPPTNSRLDGELFYQLLVGEISAQGGDSAAAYGILLDAARKSNAPNVYERAIQVAFSARNGDAALLAAKAWASAAPGAVDANRYVVQILVGLNKLPDTVAPIKRGLVSMTPADRLATIELLPRYFARATDRTLAAKTVEQALSTEVGNRATGPWAWAVIGQMRLQASDAPGALEAARKGAEMDPTAQGPALLALALLQPLPAASEPIVVRYLASQSAPEVRMGYTRYLVGAQRLDDASAQAKRLTTQTPLFADGWLIRGSLELQERKFAEAEESLTTYLARRAPAEAPAEPVEMDRGQVQAYFLLSQLAELTQRQAQAMGYLESIYSPQDAMRVGARKASLLARQGKTAEALGVIRAIPEGQPDDARNKLGAEVQLLRELKDFKGAYTTLEQQLPRFATDIDLQYDLAMLAEKVGKLDEMERLLRAVIAAKPDYHAAYNALGYSLADRNIRLDEARQLIAKALEFAPKDPFIVDSMAWVEFRSGNASEASRLLQSAFQDRPDAEIAAHWGEVLWSLGQRDEARKVWKQGQQLNPQNETLLETLRRLDPAP